MDTINLMLGFLLGVGLLYSLRRARQDDVKLAEAICKVALRVKRLERAVLPDHDIDPD